MQKHSIARAVAGARWNPRDGLIGNDQGLWLDPSDLTTMFQDAAGTTPVTAVEQPVGRILDKSGRGNHAFQSNLANRPTLSARYNLLTKTEDFSDAAWTKQAGTVVSSTKVSAPDGSLTAFSITGNGTSGIFATVAGAVSLGETTRSVYLRAVTGTATVGIKDPARTQGTTTCNLTSVWQRFSLTETTAPSAGLAGGIWVFNIPATGIEMAWPDFRSANQASLPYQRVNTATDYDSDPTRFPRRINYASGQSMTVSLPASLGSSCVVARASPGVNAVIAENQTVNTPLTLNTSHSGLVITSRAISIDEKARLDEYLDKKAIAK